MKSVANCVDSAHEVGLSGGKGCEHDNMVFTGFFEHAIDDKNRLAIPAKFRRGLDPECDGKAFMIVPGQPPDRLWLYTDRHFERLATQAASELIPDEDQLQFDQIFFPLAEYAEPDKQGRILIPEKMLRRSGLGKEVVICGVRDHLEIRPREAFDQQLDEAWGRFRDYQVRARKAYQDSARRQSGHEPD